MECRLDTRPVHYLPKKKYIILPSKSTLRIVSALKIAEPGFLLILLYSAFNHILIISNISGKECSFSESQSSNTGVTLYNKIDTPP